MFVSVPNSADYILVRELVFKLMALIYDDYEKLSGKRMHVNWRDHPMNPIMAADWVQVGRLRS